jgi:hypothetical protein
MSKNFTKEQLENDALVTGYANTIIYVRNNRATIIGITVAIIVLIGGIIGYNIYSKSQESAAQAFLGYTEQFFVRADYETALNGDNSLLGVGLNEIIANYGRTNAANLARYYAAISEQELGNSTTALAHMNKFKAPKGILGVGALSFHAVLLDNAGLHKDAANKFKQAANWDDNSSTTPHNLLRAAQSAVLAGDNRMASQLVDEILNKYESSPAATNALKIRGSLAAN